MTADAVDRILTKLSHVKRNGHGWTARCPAHDDREASLSVGEGEDGRALIKCFAGCATPAIVDALGLQIKDLFSTTAQNGHAKGGRGGY